MEYGSNYRNLDRRQRRFRHDFRLNYTRFVALLVGRHRHWPSDSDSPFRLRPICSSSGLSGQPAFARRATARRGRKLNALLAVLLFAASGGAQAKTITAVTPSLFDVTKAIGSAVDGDTVIVPAGTATWTAKLAITKGITLKGQTTVASAGTSSPTATDLTIIKDHTPATGPIIRVTSNAFFKMVGLTFVPGTRTTIGWAEGAIHWRGC